MARRWILYISRVSYKPEFKPPYVFAQGEEAAVWLKQVVAETRTAALEKALPAMRSEQHKLQGKFVSVFVGTKDPSSLPGRLHPLQVVIETWTIRDVSAERRARATNHQEVVK